MEDRITYAAFVAEAHEIAADAIAEAIAQGADDVLTEAMEYIWQSCDMHRWAIYYHNAIELCATIDIAEAEAEFEDFGGWQKGDTFGSIACRIAFSALRIEAEQHAWKIANEMECAA